MLKYDLIITFKLLYSYMLVFYLFNAKKNNCLGFQSKFSGHGRIMAFGLRATADI